MQDRVIGKPPTIEQLADANSAILKSLGGLDREGLQAFMEGREKSSVLEKTVDKLACYPREQFISKVGYPEDYKGPRPIREQIMTLAERFNLDPSGALQAMHDAGPKHKHAEGWFAAVNWKVLGRNYMKQCWKVFDWIREYSMRPSDNIQHEGKEYGMFSFSHVGGFSDSQIGFHPSYNTWRLYHPQDKHDPIWIFPAQFGLGRAGQSHRRAVELCKRTKSEYPLSIFEVACMIALHPERLGIGFYEQLWAIAPGSVEIAKPDAFNTQGLDDRYFSFHGDKAKTVNGYNRHCCFGSNTGWGGSHWGPVTAWKWENQAWQEKQKK